MSDRKEPRVEYCSKKVSMSGSAMVMFDCRVKDQRIRCEVVGCKGLVGYVIQENDSRALVCSQCANDWINDGPTVMPLMLLC